MVVNAVQTTMSANGWEGNLHAALTANHRVVCDRRDGDMYVDLDAQSNVGETNMRNGSGRAY